MRFFQKKLNLANPIFSGFSIRMHSKNKKLTGHVYAGSDKYKQYPYEI